VNYIDDLKIMRDSYYEIERRFIEISRIIPLDNDPKTYSPRLYEILQTSCGQVENLLRLICDKLELEPEEKKFPSYYKKLNETGILERQVVDYFSGEWVTQPFRLGSEDDYSPFWWKSYNKTKHDLPKGYKKGNLENTIYALAGVYALHCMGTYAQHSGTNILENSEWLEETGVALNTLKPYTDVEWIKEDVRPRSQIFYPVSYFRPLGGL